MDLYFNGLDAEEIQSLLSQPVIASEVSGASFTGTLDNGTPFSFPPTTNDRRIPIQQQSGTAASATESPRSLTGISQAYPSANVAISPAIAQHAEVSQGRAKMSEDYNKSIGYGSAFVMRDTAPENQATNKPEFVPHLNPQRQDHAQDSQPTIGQSQHASFEPVTIQRNDGGQTTPFTNTTLSPDTDKSSPSAKSNSKKRKASETPSNPRKRGKAESKPEPAFQSWNQAHHSLNGLFANINIPRGEGTFHDFSREDAKKRILRTADDFEYYRLPINRDDVHLASEKTLKALSEALYRALLVQPAELPDNWPQHIQEDYVTSELKLWVDIKNRMAVKEYQLDAAARTKELLYLAKELHTKGIATADICNLHEFADDQGNVGDFDEAELKVPGGYVLEQATPFISRVQKMIKAMSNKHAAWDVLTCSFSDLMGLIWAPKDYLARKLRNGRGNYGKKATKKKGQEARKELEMLNAFIAQTNNAQPAFNGSFDFLQAPFDVLPSGNEAASNQQPAHNLGNLQQCQAQGTDLDTSGQQVFSTVPENYDFSQYQSAGPEIGAHCSASNYQDTGHESFNLGFNQTSVYENADYGNAEYEDAGYEESDYDGAGYGADGNGYIG